jgi:hypothetical protein
LRLATSPTSSLATRSAVEGSWRPHTAGRPLRPGGRGPPLVYRETRPLVGRRRTGTARPIRPSPGQQSGLCGHAAAAPGRASPQEYHAASKWEAFRDFDQGESGASASKKKPTPRTVIIKLGVPLSSSIFCRRRPI